jgi:glyoxylase-like metal-dependent hydrolase (beta-lactamase superfamily II)
MTDGTDHYSGEVSPGDRPDRRTAGSLEITKVSVDPEMHNNCYLLRCTETGDQVLIDAADEPERLLELIGDGGLTTVITTHQHWDHHRALPAVDQRVGEHDRIAVGTCSLLVIPVAGHTPGSICLLYDDSSGGSGRPHLFTGDCLFPGGPGRTTNPDDFESIMNDLEARVFDVLPDETWFYPGHGNDSTLGVERPKIPEWRARGW